MTELSLEELTERIFNYEKFRCAYECGILSYEEFIKLAGSCFPIKASLKIE